MRFQLGYPILMWFMHMGTSMEPGNSPHITSYSLSGALRGTSWQFEGSYLSSAWNMVIRATIRSSSGSSVQERT
eukprot:CAMPEP_0194541460 /NCGR_PEP_ID=MMETSP0253-20130528/82237_1 /TAXON_ID=2966 /ORGANISM="Noctiluca scintillans" /LENGTH=73 /DNA_ID=CAMNT_0039387947 /DNA_START=329 /DNA_END=550 /DNA_ORIENTATION=+